MKKITDFLLLLLVLVSFQRVNAQTTITCPQDIVVDNDLGTCSAVVTYSNPTVPSTVPPNNIAGFTTIGYSNGSMFYIQDAPGMLPSGAYTNAHYHGGYVATIKNAQVNQFLTNYLATNNISGVLIGLNDLAVEGDYVWDSGEPFSYSNWNAGEPNNSGNEDYTMLFQSGYWNDIREIAGNTFRYILEIPGRALYQSAGLPSGSTFPIGTTTNTFNFTDINGNNGTCSFNVTVNIPSCPEDIIVNADTGACTATVTYNSPNTSDLDCIPPNNITGFTTIGYNNGSMFYIQDAPGMWPSGAYTNAHSHGGYVGTIKNAQVNQFLTDYLVANNISEALIGLNDLAVEGVFVWDSGEPFSYSNWNTGEPNNSGNEDYTILFQSGYWNDIREIPGNTFRYILEIPGRALYQSAGLPSGSTFPIGTTTNTFNFTDINGNNGTCSFNVTVNIPSCPEDIIVNADTGACTATVTYNSPNTSDLDCIPPNNITGFTTIGYNNGSMFYIQNGNGVVPSVAYINAHYYGGYVATIKNAQVNQFITNYLVANNISGVLIGLNDLAVEGDYVWDSGEPFSYSNWNAGEPNNSGNEDYTMFFQSGYWNDIREIPGNTFRYILEIPGKAFEVTSGLLSGSDFPIGTNEITMEAISESNNLITCSFNVIVNDNIAPQITCINDITVDAENNSCSAVVNYNLPTFSDNCTISLEPINGFTPIGAVNGSRFYISDASLSGLDAYNDAIAHNGFVASISDATENQFISDFMTNNNITRVRIGLSDVNSESNFEWQDGSTFNYSNWNAGEPNGGTTENYTEMYSSGLWNDIPNSFLERYILELPGDYLYQTAGLPSGSEFPLGTTTNTFKVYDFSGNFSECNLDVTVEDNTNPNVICQNITVALDANGTATIDASMIDNGSTDNCGIDTMNLDITSFDCTNIGDNNVVLTVTDNSGNTATCTAVVTVEDNTNPIITCPSDFTFTLSAGTSTYSLPDFYATGDLSVTDNCTVTVVQTPLPNTDLSVGTHIISFDVSDASGNISSCSFTITVDTNLAVQDIALSSLVEIYPNPVVNNLNIKSSNLIIENVKVYDLLGKEIIQIDTRNISTIDVSQLVSSKYFIAIKTNKGMVIKSFYKN